VLKSLASDLIQTLLAQKTFSDCETAQLALEQYKIESK